MVCKTQTITIVQDERTNLQGPECNALVSNAEVGWSALFFHLNQVLT